NPGAFVFTLLDAVTFAGLLFIVASGFSLIFGLMRVVNMAHGSFYLLGGYIAYEVQQKMTGEGFTIAGVEVTTWEWVLPAAVAAGAIGLVGLFIQQAFLRWNQGQELRQALITIAISVIIADQVIAHFNDGIAVSVTWPGWTNQLVALPLLGVDYSVARLVVLFLGLAVGGLLWVWLYRTRTGMVIRAGVDDQQMTSALGVNIQLTFAIAFVVGSALAAFGGVVGASQGAVAPGQDGQWLLNSLIVVIIGGMGSLLGAAAGSLLYGLMLSFSAVYLPTTGDNCCTQYSIVVTFMLLALVLAFRPQGLFGKFT
ncbi:MAG: branched-chain amino acid ABC transporter permease, partial [Gaiella sp.]